MDKLPALKCEMFALIATNLGTENQTLWAAPASYIGDNLIICTAPSEIFEYLTIGPRTLLQYFKVFPGSEGVYDNLFRSSVENYFLCLTNNVLYTENRGYTATENLSAFVELVKYLCKELLSQGIKEPSLMLVLHRMFATMVLQNSLTPQALVGLIQYLENGVLEYLQEKRVDTVQNEQVDSVFDEFLESLF